MAAFLTNKQHCNNCRNSQSSQLTHRQNELIAAVRSDRAVQNASEDTVADSRENLCPYQSGRYFLITFNGHIALKNTLDSGIIVSCACEFILLLSVVFYLVRSLEIFGLRLVTD